MRTVNFGIDLGTTNSLIARSTDGEIEVFKNPVGFRETLPSVVAFRNGRIIVGDKARELIDKDANNVFSCFKRKMGTDQSFWVESISRTIDPVELSSHVMKELKNFVYTGENIGSVVITIPASFDTVQSNATKEAGYRAGFQEVFLLQEPIAASLAYANNKSGKSNLEGYWMVYDLGGGTFDVAILCIRDGEMKVVDHVGDNYFGGLDFDHYILEKILIPKIMELGKFEHIHKEMKSAKGRLNADYYKLLKKCEEIKIQLSISDSAEIEFEIEDEEGRMHEVMADISREEFEHCIEQKIMYSLDVIEKILKNNRMSANELSQVLLIGGSTYIPLVRKKISDVFKVRVNSGIDPTNAVAVGAAYFAGNKPTALREEMAEPVSLASADTAGLSVKLVYSKSSMDLEEYLAGMALGDTANLFYRVTRSDGGFDTGIKPLKEKFGEYIRLMPEKGNQFVFQVMDAMNNPLPEHTRTFQIAQGKYGLRGQPLPNDICLEIDDYDLENTKLEVVFEKNDTLPLRKTIVKRITKSIKKGSNSRLVINMLEGNRSSRPSSCNKLGVIEINGQKISGDIAKGSDVEILVQMSESRDISVNVTLLMTDQEFNEVFSVNKRSVSITKLAGEINFLRYDIQAEKEQFSHEDAFEKLGKLQAFLDELDELGNELNQMDENDITDKKFQAEEAKRRISSDFDLFQLENNRMNVIESYFVNKAQCLAEVTESKNTSMKTRYDNIVRDEDKYLRDGGVYTINNKIKQLWELCWLIIQKKPMVIIDYFHYLSVIDLDSYSDRQKAKDYLTIGQKAMDKNNYEELYSVVVNLSHMLPQDMKKNFDNNTGIG